MLRLVRGEAPEGELKKVIERESRKRASPAPLLRSNCIAKRALFF